MAETSSGSLAGTLEVAGVLLCLVGIGGAVAYFGEFGHLNVPVQNTNPFAFSSQTERVLNHSAVVTCVAIGVSGVLWGLICFALAGLLNRADAIRAHLGIRR
jgi:hypothetical protein